MILTEENFTVFAARFYENNNCESNEEFEKDLAIFKYLKKLFYVYEHKNDLRERLILNHLIILYNIFEAKSCTKMLVLRMNKYHEYLFPFLLFLGYLPNDRITGIYDKEYVLRISDVKLDYLIVEKLREIKNSGRSPSFNPDLDPADIQLRVSQDSVKVNQQSSSSLINTQ